MQSLDTKKASFRRAALLCWLAASLLLVALVLLLWGSWDSGPSVAGTVLVDGQPLLKGRIRFVPIEGKAPDAGTAIQEGKYRIDRNLTVGKYKVEIQGTRLNPQKKIPDPTGSGLVTAEVNVVAGEFNEIKMVNPGSNTIDFAVPGIRKGK